MKQEEKFMSKPLVNHLDFHSTTGSPLRQFTSGVVLGGGEREEGEEEYHETGGEVHV